MGEIKRTEANEINQPQIEGYNSIKPKEQRNPDLAREYLKSNYTEIRENHQDKPITKVVDGNTEYYDDNGKNYRTNNELKPNTEYTVNGYHYETDDKGRKSSVEGQLQLTQRNHRLNIHDCIEDIGKGDQLPGDERGHLIGDRFNGSNGLENIIAQDAKINKGDYNKFEEELAKAVKQEKDVNVKIELEYTEDSHRPESLSVTYLIDGEKNIRTFPNRKD